MSVRLGARRSKFGGIAVLVALLTLALSGSAQAALRAPALQAPAGSAAVEALPTFTWGAVKNAAQYEFQLSDDQKFTSIVLGTGKGRGSQQTRNTAATLEKTVPDGNYFWRVRAISAKARVGAWSKARSLTKLWNTAPVPLGPVDNFNATWPSAPLLLRWSPVPHATKYLVTIATDKTLAQIVGGPVAGKPIEVPGTAFALQGTLPQGPYYWSITPVDAGGLRGKASDPRAFTWSWPTTTATSNRDLNDTEQVVDPQLSWNLVPGAARYEVEINPDNDFAAGSRVCCKDPVIGTSLSPVRILPNNNDLPGGSGGYNWRVRAFDIDGNPGVWNVGAPFDKPYDNVVQTVPNVTVETVTSADASSASPLVTWGPVPGAAQYQVQWTEFSGGFCGWSNASAPIKTSSLAWTPLAPSTPRPTGVPGGIGITPSLAPNGTTTRFGQPFVAERAYPTPAVAAFIDGTTYCVRVRALSDDSYRENDGATSQVISLWTQAGPGDENAPAFTYGGSPALPDPAPSQLPAPTYLTPGAGEAVTRTPTLRWTPVAGARRYFVIIARDSNFTNVVDAAFTAMPAYVPNHVLEDETTSYFWAVIPSSQSNGSGISGGPRSYSPQTFNKQSAVPALIEPVGGTPVGRQPAFRWTAAEGAQKYHIQVSADPAFGDLLDDVVTSSTAYTSSTPYPVDTVLYWRVRAEQLQALAGTTRVELSWSAIGSFRRTLPSPAFAADIPLSGELPPALTWAPIDGAISYDVHIDQPDGVSNDFNIKSSAATFTKLTGIGTFNYRVRANFGARSGVVTSAYSAQRGFTRLISAPGSPRVTLSKTRLFFSWSPAAAAKSYRVQVSTTESFATILETATTANTSWAPALTSPLYTGKGPLYWRVSTVDEGNNVGSSVGGAVRKGRLLTVRIRGHLRRNVSSRLTVTVRGSGQALRSAGVRASGAGLKTTSKSTGKRGTASLRLRPTKTGTVTIVVSRAGYATRTVKVRVR